MNYYLPIHLGNSLVIHETFSCGDVFDVCFDIAADGHENQ